MPYTKQWGSTHPGCLIVLLDQSGSMAAPFGGTQLGAGHKKCDMVATILNSLLHEFILTNTVGTTIRPRADVAVLGYGSGVLSSLTGRIGSALSGPLKSKDFVTLPELMANPVRVETRNRKELDEKGQMVEQQVSFPVWVEPVAGNGTPMCAALKRARDLAKKWVETHSEHYPPVVINITDGASTDGDPVPAATALKSVQTSDGGALLFNCHITNLTDAPVAFPASEGQIPDDRFARELFGLSSEIPESARKNILAATGSALLTGARGFVFNGDANSVRQMFIFATVGASQADQNR